MKRFYYQLKCKEQDIDGRFCCSLDGDILDHEGIYCDKFEEYKENEDESKK